MREKVYIDNNGGRHITKKDISIKKFERLGYKLESKPKKDKAEVK